MDVNSINWGVVIGIIIIAWGVSLLTVDNNSQSVVLWIWSVGAIIFGLLVIAESIFG